MIHFVGDKAKGRISKRVFQENNARQIFRKTNISYPLISTLQKCSFFGKFGVLYFLEPPVLRFALLPFYRQFHQYLCYLRFSTAYFDLNHQ